MSLAFCQTSPYDNSMLWRYVIMIAILIAAGMAFYPSKETHTPTALPDVSFALPNGEQSSLHSFKGKVTLIHFWASWCPPCLPEIPELIALAQAHPDDLTIIAFSLDKTAADMKRFFNVKFGELPANFIPLWDEGGSIARDSFYSLNYPETYIMGCAGNLRDKIIGPASNWETEIEPHLAACIK
ncbi:MAG: TlpA disulfide reductase family protein [Rickettsiales bacterium]|nr:TlpA disulfide reductase family protein [Rickettsiales bacterium]